MKTKSNDAAFSNASDQYGNSTIGYGLTKREYFAALAMQGAIASNYKQQTTKEIAKRAVELANALIEELNRETK